MKMHRNSVIATVIITLLLVVLCNDYFAQDQKRTKGTRWSVVFWNGVNACKPCSKPKYSYVWQNNAASLRSLLQADDSIKFARPFGIMARKHDSLKKIASDFDAYLRNCSKQNLVPFVVFAPHLNIEGYIASIFPIIIPYWLLAEWSIHRDIRWTQSITPVILAKLAEKGYTIDGYAHSWGGTIAVKGIAAGKTKVRSLTLMNARSCEHSINRLKKKGLLGIRKRITTKGDAPTCPGKAAYGKADIYIKSVVTDGWNKLNPNLHHNFFFMLSPSTKATIEVYGKTVNTDLRSIMRYKPYQALPGDLIVRHGENILGPPVSTHDIPHIGILLEDGKAFDLRREKVGNEYHGIIYISNANDPLRFKDPGFFSVLESALPIEFQGKRMKFRDLPTEIKNKIRKRVVQIANAYKGKDMGKYSFLKNNCGDATMRVYDEALADIGITVLRYNKKKNLIPGKLRDWFTTAFVMDPSKANDILVQVQAPSDFYHKQQDEDDDRRYEAPLSDNNDNDRYKVPRRDDPPPPPPPATAINDNDDNDNDNDDDNDEPPPPSSGAAGIASVKYLVGEKSSLPPDPTGKGGQAGPIPDGFPFPFSIIENRLGGIKLSRRAEFTGTLSTITGAVYDPRRQCLVLVGEENITLPSIKPEDLAVALACVFNPRYGDPQFSLDPADPRNPCGKWLKAVYIPKEILSGTPFGKALFEADWLLKQYAFGVSIDKKGRLKKRVSAVPGFKSTVDLSFELENFGKGHARCARFWIVADKLKLRRHQNSIYFDVVKMRVKAKKQVLDPQSPTGLSDVEIKDPVASAFADKFTELYDAISRESPEFARIKELAKAVALAKWIKQEHIPVDMKWVEKYVNKRINTVGRIPTLSATFEKRTKIPFSQGNLSGIQTIIESIHVFGGVDLTATPTFEPDNGQTQILQQEVVLALQEKATRPVFKMRHKGKVLRAVVLPITKNGQELWQNSASITKNGVIYQFNREGIVSKSIDRFGNIAEYSYDARRKLKVIKLKTPDGWQAYAEKNDRGSLLTITNPLGNTFRYQYANCGRLRKICVDVDGRRLANYTYDTKLRELTIEYQGYKKRFVYESDGYVRESETCARTKPSIDETKPSIDETYQKELAKLQQNRAREAPIIPSLIFKQGINNYYRQLIRLRNYQLTEAFYQSTLSVSEYNGTYTLKLGQILQINPDLTEINFDLAQQEKTETNKSRWSQIDKHKDALKKLWKDLKVLVGKRSEIVLYTPKLHYDSATNKQKKLQKAVTIISRLLASHNIHVRIATDLDKACDNFVSLHTKRKRKVAWVALSKTLTARISTVIQEAINKNNFEGTYCDSFKKVDRQTNSIVILVAHNNASFRSQFEEAGKSQKLRGKVLILNVCGSQQDSFKLAYKAIHEYGATAVFYYNRTIRVNSLLSLLKEVFKQMRASPNTSIDKIFHQAIQNLNETDIKNYSTLLSEVTKQNTNSTLPRLYKNAAI